MITTPMVRAAWFALVLLGAVGLLFAQNTPGPTNVPLGASGAAPAAPARQDDSDRPALQERYSRYQVTRSDVLSLSFPLSPEFNRQVTVQPDGYINLQGTHSVYVQGMTVPEIVQALKQAYKGVLKDPIIDVDLADFQKPYFIAGGQVNKPGQYDLRHDTTVSQALAIAGGITSGGKTQVFLYHHSSPGWIEVKKLNVKEIYHGKNVNEDARLQPGDTLFVPEKMITMFRKYIPYSVGTAFNPQAAFTQ